MEDNLIEAVEQAAQGHVDFLIRKHYKDDEKSIEALINYSPKWQTRLAAFLDSQVYPEWLEAHIIKKSI